MERDVIEVCKTIMIGVLFTAGRTGRKRPKRWTTSLPTVWLTRSIAKPSLEICGPNYRRGTERRNSVRFRG